MSGGLCVMVSLRQSGNRQGPSKGRHNMVAIAQAAGLRVCAWCGHELGAAEGLPVGQITHGICPECAAGLLDDARAEARTVPPQVVFWAVRRHPSGGWTHADPVNAVTSTARIYRGWWRTRAAAAAALVERMEGRA